MCGYRKSCQILWGCQGCWNRNAAAPSAGSATHQSYSVHRNEERRRLGSNTANHDKRYFRETFKHCNGAIMILGGGSFHLFEFGSSVYTSGCKLRTGQRISHPLTPEFFPQKRVSSQQRCFFWSWSRQIAAKLSKTSFASCKRTFRFTLRQVFQYFFWGVQTSTDFWFFFCILCYLGKVSTETLRTVNIFNIFLL